MSTEFEETAKYLFHFVRTCSSLGFDHPEDYVAMTANGRLYEEFCKVSDIAIAPVGEKLSHRDVIETMLDKKCFDINHGMVETIAEMLQDKDPFYELLHLRLMEALMKTSTVEVTLEKVHEEIQILPDYHQSRDAPFDIDDALMIWIHKCSSKSEEYGHDLFDYTRDITVLNSVVDRYDSSNEELKKMFLIIPYAKGPICLRHFAAVIFKKLVLKGFPINAPLVVSRKNSVIDNQYEQSTILDSYVEDEYVAVEPELSKRDNEDDDNDIAEETDSQENLQNQYEEEKGEEDEDNDNESFIDQYSNDTDKEEYEETEEEEDANSFLEEQLKEARELEERGEEQEDFIDDYYYQDCGVETKMSEIEVEDDIYVVDEQSLVIDIPKPEGPGIIRFSSENLEQEPVNPLPKQTLSFVSLDNDNSSTITTGNDNLELKRQRVLARLEKRHSDVPTQQHPLDKSITESKQEILKTHNQHMEMIFSGTTLSKAPVTMKSSKSSNINVIKNALGQILQSKLHATTLATALHQMTSYHKLSPKVDFIILLKNSPTFIYKGLYALHSLLGNDQQILLRIHGNVPTELDSTSDISGFYKYSTSARSFLPLETHHLSFSVHAVTK